MNSRKINDNAFHLMVVFLMVYIHLSYSLFEKNASLLVPRSLNHDLNCQKWNANIFTKSDSIKRLVQATFQPFLNYEKCFTYYHVFLQPLAPNRFECNIANGKGIKRKILEPYSQKMEGIYEVTFTNLEAGYYCILFQPCARKCYENLLHSNVTRIQEKLTITFEQNVKKATTSSTVTDIAYICVILTFTFICSGIIYWNYKHRKLRKIPENVVEKGEDLPLLSPKDTKVFIFHYPDEETTKHVEDLEDFLQKCAGFDVTVIDDTNPIIPVNPILFLDAILQCCSTNNEKCTCNNRFIIVMTKHVLEYISSFRKFGELNDSTEDDIEADWFLFVLNRILIDWSKCLKDYTHFFVIYFDESLYERDYDEIAITPNVRFSIQHHLVKLCQELNYSFHDASHKRELENSLDKHPIRHIVSANLENCKYAK